MSALSVIRAPGPGGSDPGGAMTTDFRGQPRLRLVRQSAGAAGSGRSAAPGDSREPCSSSIPAAGRSSRRPVVVTGTVIARRGVSRTPVRLTRRGRAVVAALVVTGLTIAALLASLLVSGRAQATNHGQARAGYQGMHEIVVQPGQTLWSIALAAEPTADTRVVVQEIMTANALGSSIISTGQLLWVPR
jgi:LysM domain